MLTPPLYKLLIPMLCAASLASCGGDKNENASSNIIDIDQQESPVANTEGTKTQIATNISVYILSSNGNKTENKKSTVNTNNQITNGDKSKLLRETFFEFNNLSTFNTLAVIESNEKIKNVIECDKITNECKDISMEFNEKNNVIFQVQKNKYYAIER